MTLTLDNLPEELEARLRKLAEESGRTPEAVALAVLEDGLHPMGPRRRDVRSLIATFKPEPWLDQLEAELAEMDRASMPREPREASEQDR